MQEQAKIQHIPIKVYRTAERLVIAAPMPGSEPEDILVKVSENSVVMQGDIRALLKDVKELLIDEWSVGSYYREVQLPNPVDGEHANVTYGNGVLIVNLPISEKTVPATLVLEKTGVAHGERVGNAGHA
ncbi:MAG: Hsp20/alpha crystallin family protein [Ktedonobacteraceae bacterium]|nr:Hsp20/alpha crystallin family protein [Ktedonobacteraceae bacterium]MBV9616135.1 Hsp20/alpha crystallin family protein [Ktedonobacteraceae bacterium]MBV9713673.1 Hsp20/alpha crystallin family protein [Ktedonobacteraceae bacterium]